MKPTIAVLDQHWEKDNDVRSHVEIAFNIGVDSETQASVKQLRNDLFATLYHDLLPRVVAAYPDGALGGDGAIDSDFDVFEVNAEVPKDGFKGEWRKEAGGNAVLNGSVKVDLASNNVTPPADMLQTMRANVADDIAELIANSYGSFVRGKSSRPAAKTKVKALESSAA